MKPTPIHYFIFVRPPGSWTWTLHMHKPTDAIGYVPWRSGDADGANREACHIVEHTNLCAIVVPITLPQEQDTEQFALLADGDSMYLPTKPMLLSKRTGEGVI